MLPIGVYMKTEEHKKKISETLRMFSKDDVDIMKQLYVEEGLSSYEVAKELGVSSKTVLRYLKRFGIPIRSRSEALKLKGPRSEETRRKISEAHIGKKCSEEHKNNMSRASKKRWQDEGYRKKNKAAWIDGRSFLPYCPKFNYKLKEEIRNRDNRVCQMPDCGKSEILNGRRLSVHHIDGDKMQGCSGKQWSLVALCLSCNTKKDTIEKEFLIVSNLGLKEKERNKGEVSLDVI